MSDAGQPGARLQYDYAKRFNGYRMPTHEEWARDYDALSAEVENWKASHRHAVGQLNAVVRQRDAALIESADLRNALAGETGLVQLLTARRDLQPDREAILSNHRHIEALRVLERTTVSSTESPK